VLVVCGLFAFVATSSHTERGRPIQVPAVEPRR
jgi:hypothetical protein